MALPQHINSEDLQYARPQTETTETRSHLSNHYQQPRKHIPNNSLPHVRLRSLCLHTRMGNFLLLIGIIGSCWFIRMEQVPTMGKLEVKVDVHSSRIVVMIYLYPATHRKVLTTLHGMFFFRLEDVGPTGLREAD